MAQQVVMTAMLQCTFGVAPASLLVTSQQQCLSSYMLCATIMDYAPITNIPTFSMCTTQSNPAVAAATSAALGVPTPAPCVPATAAPWTPGATTVLIGNQPALDNTSKCMCSYGGSISITSAGQTSEMIP